MKTLSPSRQLIADIKANVADYFADRKTHEQFSAAQRSLWAKAEAQGLTAVVTRMMLRGCAR